MSIRNQYLILHLFLVRSLVVTRSSGTFLSRHDDKAGILARIEDRIAEVTMVPASHGEAFNFLHYENGQHYDAHYDLFRQEDYGPQSKLKWLCWVGILLGRLDLFYIYLNELLFDEMKHMQVQTGWPPSSYIYRM